MVKTTVLLLLLGLVPGREAHDAGRQPSSPPAGSWVAVQTLTTRDELRVEMGSGEIRRGRFLGATEETLSLMQHGTPVCLERGKVRSVYRLTPRPRGKHVATGAAIGGALGMLGCLIGDVPSGTSRGGVCAAGLVVDGGLGALVGYGVAGRGEFLLIYHSGR